MDPVNFSFSSLTLCSEETASVLLINFCGAGNLLLIEGAEGFPLLADVVCSTLVTSVFVFF